jgi:hypothetical protein
MANSVCISFRIAFSRDHLFRLSEECLIDFAELVGDHSGDSMANIVWKTLEKYGLKGRVSYCFRTRYGLLTSQLDRCVRYGQCNK